MPDPHAPRVIVITGAFGVLGTAVADAFIAKGDKVALIDRAPAPPNPSGDSALRKGGVDLGDFAAAQAVMDEIAGHFGRIDGLVNIAGGFRWETLADGDIATWDFMYAVNLKTAVCACKAALPHLLKTGAGRIVNIGAGAAAKAGMGMGAYTASKAGVAKLTESLSEEVKGRGTTVNAVLPSIIDTPQNRKDMPNEDFSRWVTPTAIAQVILFLASPEAQSVTGALIPVSGLL